MKEYYKYTICPECDSITYYNNKLPNTELLSICNNCNCDVIVIDNDLVIDEN